MRRRTLLGGAQPVIVLLLSALCVLTFLPFVWIVVTALKPNAEIYSLHKQFLPKAPTLVHFVKVIQKGDQLPSYVLNTLVYSGVTIAIVSLLAAMAGYALGQLRFRGAQLFVNLMLVLLSVPWVILMVPILMFEFRLGVYNTRTGLILPYIGLFLPVAIWIMRGTFLGMSKELGQAARIDGAGEFRVFWQIYLPMAKAGVATVVLLTFIQVWNEVLLASTLAINPEIANINTGLRVLQDEGQAFAFGTLSAVILLAMIPTLIVFVLLQRYYVRGVAEGAFSGF
ncbi:MAG TPA: carbohydrate ABC transporter permease [Methylomirabilota bacterium]|nr:carbohydrate ABC transporter permease [Methylomirabilota bacterium]